MYIQNIYQPFASIRLGALVFGTLIHHKNDEFQKVELFSMSEDNRKLLSQAMRFEGTELNEMDVCNVLHSSVIMPFLVVTKHPRRTVTLFSPDIYFGISDDSFSNRAPEEVLTERELCSCLRTRGRKSEDYVLVWEEYIRDQYIRSVRSVLTHAFDTNGSVYAIYDHCLSDFLDEAELEMKEYANRWNGARSAKKVSVA